MGGKLVVRRPVDADPGNVAAPAANTAATVTFAAAAGKRHIVEFIGWSYSAAPTGGRLTVKDGATDVVLDLDVTAAGPGSISPLIRGALGNAVEVTLAAGGAGISGKLNAYKATEPR